ncbi:MAG TPA: DUF58 domain-containing protein [Burkholderiales bacterium]|nr:DUF58 domain-containing protein [Burkholderiales bacterium]
MLRALRTDPRWVNWFYGFAPPERGRIRLGHRRVYIVPTQLGWMFGGVLAILLIGSINYSLSLGYGLTFLLAGLGFAGMIHTARNLARLEVSTGRIEPVFAGEAAQFLLRIDNPSPFDRPSILVRHVASGVQLVVDVAARSAADAVLGIRAERRGRLPLGRVMIETRFPLGLFRAWSYVEPEIHCLVYPRPARSPLPRAAVRETGGRASVQAGGNDDFAGLRLYQPADSPRHIAWKRAAQSDELLTKQFSHEAAQELWLDWQRTNPRLDVEERLSVLAGWVLAAEQAGARYGLRLPGTEIAPGQGDAKRAQCLEALALHDAR